jgi:hypothetical protein
MVYQLNLRIRRYLSASDFAADLKQLKAFRGTSFGDSLLESLEEHRLVRPKLRLCWPDPVARRMWLERHDYVGSMHETVEPDGARWEAAVRLSNRLFQHSHRRAYGNVSHPFDNPDPAFPEFLQRPVDQSFQPHCDRRVSVANDCHPVLYDPCNIQDYYSGWQVLLATEVADMGIHIRLNMADPDTAKAVHEAMLQGRWPNGRAHELFAPARALRGFHKHEAALDAIVWSVEEADDALNLILRNQGGGRVILTEEQVRAYDAARVETARCEQERHNVHTPEIISVCKFLAGRWLAWNSEGRPLIAQAYKVYLASAVHMLKMTADMTFDDITVAVGHLGNSSKPALDVVWPDWARDQKERVSRTLQNAVMAKGPGALSTEEIISFGEFVQQEHQDAIFLRLESLERHAFDDVNAPLAGISSDVQGMAVAVEHAVRAMGGSKDQLYQMFKELWTEPEVVKLLKRSKTLAEQGRLPSEWPAVKAEIEHLRASGLAGAVVADLVMAHRLRGAVHHQLPEQDQFEMEKLFVVLLRAAAMTHAHVQRRKAAAALPPDAPEG